MGDGLTALFWDGCWYDFILKYKFHHLITFARDSSITVSQVIHTEYLQDLFHLPLTTQAYEEFLEMEDICISLRNSEYLQLKDT